MSSSPNMSKSPVQPVSPVMSPPPPPAHPDPVMNFAPAGQAFEMDASGVSEIRPAGAPVEMEGSLPATHGQGQI
jgi:hypothetical protein